MGFLIARISKHKTVAGVVAGLRHHFRQDPEQTLNADPELAGKNIFKRSFDDAVAAIEREHADMETGGLLRNTKVEKQRSCIAVEHLLTFSPELLGGGGSNLLLLAARDAVRKFYEVKGGCPVMIFGEALHKDESTDHLAFYVIPYRKDEKGKKRLSAAYYFDNVKEKVDGVWVTQENKMREFQDFVYAETIAILTAKGHPKASEICRGVVVDNPRRHMPIKEFYMELLRHTKLLQAIERERDAGKKRLLISEAKPYVDFYKSVVAHKDDSIKGKEFAKAYEKVKHQIDADEPSL